MSLLVWKSSQIKKQARGNNEATTEQWMKKKKEEMMKECAACGEVIEANQDRYECDECKGAYSMCTACFEDEETDEKAHEHKLRRVKGRLIARALAEHLDDETKRKVVLTNCAGAMPGSESSLLPENGGNIRAILTLLDLTTTGDEEEEEGGKEEEEGNPPPMLMEEEKAIRDLAYGRGTLRTSVRGGVTYHLVTMADVSDPAMIGAEKLANMAAEATSFVTMGLCKSGGDVAVHCYLGRRRSPTMMAAWMATRAMTVDAAIKAIGQQHAEAKQWDAEFKRLRPGWVQWLHWWRKAWKVEQVSWCKSHADEIAEWDAAFKSALAPPKSCADQRRAETQVEEEEEEEEEELLRRRLSTKKRRKTQVVSDSEDEDEDNGHDKQQQQQQQQQEQATPPAKRNKPTEEEEERNASETTAQVAQAATKTTTNKSPPTATKTKQATLAKFFQRI